MRALRLHALGAWGTTDRAAPDLRLESLADPEPQAGQVLIRVEACGVCRTVLDEIEGRAPPTALPRILGHQVVGRVVGRGAGVPPREGSLLGGAWMFGACGRCERSQSGVGHIGRSACR